MNSDSVVAFLAVCAALGLVAGALIVRACALRPDPQFRETPVIEWIGIVAVIWLCIEGMS